MAMSRFAHIPIALAAAAMPAAVPAAPGLLPAPPDPLGDIAREAARAGRGAGGCAREGDEATVVVCGQRAAGGAGGYRVPYVPVAGEVHHIAGELRTGGDAMGADGCLRLCEQPLSIDIIGAARTLGRGIGRLLHPD